MALTPQEIDAFNQVKTAVAALRAEYDDVCANIVVTKKLLDELPLLPVPVDDFKAFILDFVDARGQHYLDAKVKSSIKDLATHLMSGSEVDLKLIGSPLRFKDLESAYPGNNGALSEAQLITGHDKRRFNDLALYAFFGDLVKAGLSKVMATMTDADFGYGDLSPKQIGSDRATRRAAIQATQDQLTTLCANKVTLAGNLRQLGVIV